MSTPKHVSFQRAALAWFVVSLIASGCESLRVYDGPGLPKKEVARISGDMRVSAGKPVSIVLRRVDDTEVGFRFNSTEVLPGAHTLLIDCTVTESKRTSRHHLDVDVDAGVQYRLVADTGNGNQVCTDVQMVSVN